MNYFLETVLLVDDNEIDNILNTKLIQIDSFAKHIIVKDSADEALEFLFNEFKINKKIPELIFLDIRMPITDGFDFLESFETFHDNLKKNIKIIMLTSSLNEEDIMKANENKYVEMLLNKPLTIEALENLRENLYKS